MGFVRRNFSASWDESRFDFRLAPSHIRNISLTKTLANRTRQIIKRPELVTANALVVIQLPLVGNSETILPNG